MLLSKWKYVTEEVCDVCLFSPEKEQRFSVSVFFNNRRGWGCTNCIDKVVKDFYNYEKEIEEEKLKVIIDD